MVDELSSGVDADGLLLFRTLETPLMLFTTGSPGKAERERNLYSFILQVARHCGM